MNNILVICIGNICRSPMAEALLQRALPDCSVKSAGLGALVGKGADPHSVSLMAEQEVDISGHVAQQISQALVSEADVILVMDTEQKRYIENQYASARGKVFRLGEAAKTDIPDPYREGIDSFRHAQRLIEEGVQVWASQIAQMR
ncbi:protein-tyrosine-phosphatase [Massilia varians]|uniref:protein-tyrosine-phosphatase n=1 Tax=Massilia varians TaxID=457921 RepID=A0ABN6TEL2_9BURK|nr:low molecular weight protein-tyrosine-phosphatase [Massilia varians]BDT60637.1 protein-tyrosine-phosphatase [Massilia varians]